MNNFVIVTILSISTFFLTPILASNPILIEEQKPSRETVFKELHTYLEDHINHLEDAVSASIMLEGSQGNNGEIEMGQCIKTLKQNIVNVKEIAGFLHEVHEGRMTTKLFMETTLDLRLRNSQKRKVNLLHAKKNIDSVTYYLTSPEIINEIPESFRIFPEIIVDTYQTINKIIVGLLSLENLRTLPASTKRLLRASPSLWDRIQGLDDDLGFPDEALLNSDTVDPQAPIQSAEFLEFGDLYGSYAI